MASRYLITKNVLKEYDEYVIEQRVTGPTTEVENFRDRVMSKLIVVKKKEAKKEQPGKIKFLEFVYLHEAEYGNLITGYGVDKVKDIIERLNGYIGSKGEKYKSHYHTILNWFNQKGIKRIDKQKELAKPVERVPVKEYKPMTEEEKKIAFEKLNAFRYKLGKNDNTATQKQTV